MVAVVTVEVAAVAVAVIVAAVASAVAVVVAVVVVAEATINLVKFCHVRFQSKVDLEKCSTVELSLTFHYLLTPNAIMSFCKREFNFIISENEFRPDE